MNKKNVFCLLFSCTSKWLILNKFSFNDNYALPPRSSYNFNRFSIEIIIIFYFLKY